MEYPLGQRLRALPGPLLLTGHTGFKGTWMTFLLEHLEVPVIGYSLTAEKDSLYDRAALTGAIPEAFADIRDYEALEQFVDLHKPSTIIHMAAQPLVLKSYESPRETFDVNVMGTVNVLDIAFKRDFVKAIVIVTTDKVYRNDNSGRAFVETDPLEGKDPYSASKVGTEAVVAAWQQIAKVSGGPRVVSVRAGNVIGGGDFAKDRIIPDLVRSAISGKPVQIRNPESTRPWQHVLDPCVGYLMALEALLIGVDLKSLNFGPKEDSLTVEKVVQQFTSFWTNNRVFVQTHTPRAHSEAANLRLDSSESSNTIKWTQTLNQIESIEMTVLWWSEVLIHMEDSKNTTQAQVSKFLHKAEAFCEKPSKTH
jgi:CDP-glucose 4,6-dehydratase